MALTLCFKLSFFTLISSITYTEKAVLDKSSLGADAAKKTIKNKPETSYDCPDIFPRRKMW